MRILAIVGALATGAVLIIVGAGGAIWYTKSPTQEEAAPPVAERAAEHSDPVRSGAEQIELATVRQLLALVDAERRAVMLESPENFSNFVEQERANQAVLTAAYANSAIRSTASSLTSLRVRFHPM